MLILKIERHANHSSMTRAATCWPKKIFYLIVLRKQLEIHEISYNSLTV